MTHRTPSPAAGLIGKAYVATFFVIAAILVTLVAAVILAAPLWVILCIAAPIIIWAIAVFAFICITQPTCGPG